MTVEQDILSQFPQYAYMLNDPELHNLVVMFLNPAVPFDSGKFTAALMHTNWWQTHSSSQRDAIQQQALDPSSYNVKVQQKQDQLRQLAQGAGLALTEPELLWEANFAIQQGWDDNEARRQLIMVGAVNHGETGASRANVGSIGDAAQQVRGIAADYLLPMSDTQAGDYGTDIYLGNKTINDVKANLATWSAAQWKDKDPGLAQAMLSGTTARQYLDPQIQGVAQTLEISPDKVNLLDPKWNAIINYADPNNKGQIRTMTTAEAMNWSRQQNDYQYTNGAKTAAWQMVNTLTQQMGERK